MAYILLACLLLASCGQKANYTGVDTNSLGAIGNRNNFGSVAATEDYIYLINGGMMYKQNTATGKITFACEDPTCTHETNCPSANKFTIQSSGNHVFCYGDLETVSGATYVYSDFGEIVDGQFKKIFEADTNIYLPSITNGRLLAEMNNKIYLIDLDTGKTIKEFSFDYALALQQLYCLDETIYFVNGLAKLNALDIATGEVTQVSDRKVRQTLPCGGYIYYTTASSNETSGKLYRMKKDGTGNELIYDDCCTYNILNDTIYLSCYAKPGIFSVDLNGEKETQLCSQAGVRYIRLLEQQGKMVLGDYTDEYICGLDGSGFQKLDFPKPVQTENNWEDD